LAAGLSVGALGLGREVEGDAEGHHHVVVPVAVVLVDLGRHVGGRAVEAGEVVVGHDVLDVDVDGGEVGEEDVDAAAEARADLDAGVGLDRVQEALAVDVAAGAAGRLAVAAALEASEVLRLPSSSVVLVGVVLLPKLDEAEAAEQVEVVLGEDAREQAELAAERV
jgi:hypothetical protein